MTTPLVQASSPHGDFAHYLFEPLKDRASTTRTTVNLRPCRIVPSIRHEFAQR